MTLRFARVLLLLALALLGVVPAGAVDFLVRNWQTEDGLPDNNITAIQQTSDGYLWFGTFNGLVRFDGVQFKTFDSANTPQLRSSRILSLLADAQGTLWVGAENGGLVRMTGGVFQSVPLAGFGTAPTISSLFAAQNGAIWILVADKGVARIQDGNIQTLTETNPPVDGELTKLSDDPAVQAWLAARNNLLTFRAGSWFSRPSRGTPPTDTEIVAVQRSRNGRVWLAYPRRLISLPEPDGASTNASYPWGRKGFLSLATSVLEDQTGMLWVGTINNGLYHSTSDGGFSLVATEGPLAQNVTSAIFEDRNGLIWVGTYRGGLFRIKRRSVSLLVPPGAGEVNVQTVCAARDGAIWLGTGGAGLYRYDQGRLTRYTRTNGLTDLNINSLYEDRSTDLWVGTMGGLFLRDGERFRPATTSNVIPSRVLALYEDRAASLWVGTTEGIARKQGEHWTLFTTADGLSYPDVRAITEDREGNLWIGTAGGGLDLFRNGRFTHFGAGKGFPEKFVLALCADADGTLWIGTIGGGLVRFKEGRFTSYTLQDGLADNNIGSIIDDSLGHLWLSTQTGILRVSKQDLNQYERGRSPPLACLSLSVSDGLSTPMCSGSGQPVMARGMDGRLWVPNMKAVAIIEPGLVQRHSFRPNVMIEGVTIDGRDYAPPVDFRLRVPYGRSRFEFHYTALGLLSPEAARFRCRLEGVDRNWVSTGVSREAIYGQLAPGRYRFRVMAAGSDGVWHEALTPLGLQVVPRWWETWWFRFGAVMILVVATGLTIRMNERRKLRLEMERARRQQAVAEERARIARDIHDDIGSRLTAISLQGALALRESSPPETVREDVARMMDNTHKLVSTLDEIVWAVNPKNDTLGHLATYLCQFAKEFLEPTPIRCRLDIVPDLPAYCLTSEVRHNVFLATKEAVNNVVKHSGASRLWLRIKVEPGRFVIEVADNGRGFSPETVAESGNGLRNMAQRLERSGGQLTIQSTPGQGTTVRFDLPLTQLGDAPET